MLSAQAVGGIVGGTLMARYARRWRPEALLGWGAVGLGVVDLAIFLYPLSWPTVYPAVLLMILAGLPASGAGAAWATLVQRHTGDELRGRVFGVTGQFASVALLAGAGLANLAATTELIVPVICIHGATLLAGGAWRLVAASRGAFRDAPTVPAGGVVPAAGPAEAA